MRKVAIGMLLVAAFAAATSLGAARWLVDPQTPAPLPQARSDQIFGTLVVASQSLTFGTSLAAKDLREIPWPDDAIPAGSYSRIRDLLGDVPRVVLFPLAENEPVLASKITGDGDRGGLSALLPAGRRAVGVPVDEIAGVGGFVSPGDRVDVVLTRSGGSDGGVPDGGRADVILQGIGVLSVDQVVDWTNIEPGVPRVVTLDVSIAEAQKLVLAMETGRLSLVLRGAGDTSTVGIGHVTASHFQGLDDGDASARARITVVRSDVREDYSVPVSASAVSSSQLD
ncbi:MAG: Flp pilus assembly protein CpaB [Pseudomonadota bacterium]